MHESRRPKMDLQAVAKEQARSTEILWLAYTKPGRSISISYGRFITFSRAQGLITRGGSAMSIRPTAYLSPGDVKVPARSAWVFQLNHDDEEVIVPGSPPKPPEILFEMGLVIAAALGMALAIELAL